MIFEWEHKVGTIRTIVSCIHHVFAFAGVFIFIASLGAQCATKACRQRYFIRLSFFNIFAIAYGKLGNH